MGAQRSLARIPSADRAHRQRAGRRTHSRLSVPRGAPPPGRPRFLRSGGREVAESPSSCHRRLGLRGRDGERPGGGKTRGSLGSAVGYWAAWEREGGRELGCCLRPGDCGRGQRERQSGQRRPRPRPPSPPRFSVQQPRQDHVSRDRERPHGGPGGDPGVQLQQGQQAPGPHHAVPHCGRGRPVGGGDPGESPRALPRSIAIRGAQTLQGPAAPTPTGAESALRPHPRWPLQELCGHPLSHHPGTNAFSSLRVGSSSRACSCFAFLVSVSLCAVYSHQECHSWKGP